jgi:signal peptidase
MKNILKKVDFFTIILIIILIILTYCYAQLKIFKAGYINFCGYSIFQVVSGSMSDTIEIKDIVIVKITNDIDVNDIITFKYEDNFITHRVIEENNERIITKGDANNTQDDPITRDMVVGKVVYIFKNVAVWIDVLKTPQVIIAIIITLIAIKIMFFRTPHVKDK